MVQALEITRDILFALGSIGTLVFCGVIIWTFCKHRRATK